MSGKYMIRYFFEYGGGCLWSKFNEKALDLCSRIKKELGSNYELVNEQNTK